MSICFMADNSSFAPFDVDFYIVNLLFFFILFSFLLYFVVLFLLPLLLLRARCCCYFFGCLCLFACELVI